MVQIRDRTKTIKFDFIFLKMNTALKRLHYSAFKLFTGFINAALMAW